MGSCCSCCGSDDENGGGRGGETEMTGTVDQDHKSLSISKSMSSPGIQVDGRLTVSGNGLALAAIPIEQDAAYWEWHLNDISSRHIDTIMFGVASRKDRKFYQNLHNMKQKKKEQENGDTSAAENGDSSNDEGDEHDFDDDDENNHDDDDTRPSEKFGTNWMRKVEGIQSNDVIGVAVQQSDLPMIQFLLNGELLHELAINRFRGTVYPSIYLPSNLPKEDEDDPVKVSLVLAESQFKQMSPNARFGPVIVARSIV